VSRNWKSCISSNVLRNPLHRTWSPLPRLFLPFLRKCSYRRKAGILAHYEENPDAYLDSETITRTEYKRKQPQTGWGHAVKEQVFGS
jgi:hypothetical protein